MFTYQVNEDISFKLLVKKDIPALFKLVEESRVSLREWLPWVDSMQSIEDYEPIIEMWLKQYINHDGFQVGIVYKGNLVGMIGLHTIAQLNRKTSIGYWLAEKYEGKGIMTRAVKALVDIVFTEYNLNRVEIHCGVKNIKSQAVPERLGFHREGVLREAEYLYDHYHDLVLYSMLAKEWDMDENSK